MENIDFFSGKGIARVNRKYDFWEEVKEKVVYGQVKEKI